MTDVDGPARKKKTSPSKAKNQVDKAQDEEQRGDGPLSVGQVSAKHQC